MQFDAKCGESGGAFPPLQRAAARDASRAAGLQPEASGFRHGAHGLARPHKHPPGARPCRRFTIPAPHAAHGGSLSVSAICALQNGGHKEQKATISRCRMPLRAYAERGAHDLATGVRGTPDTFPVYSITKFTSLSHSLGALASFADRIGSAVCQCMPISPSFHATERSSCGQ